MAILGYLHFPINSLISLPVYAKEEKAALILIGIVSSELISLGSFAILTISSFLIHKLKRSFHLFRSPLLSFNDVLQCSCTGLACSVRFIQEYFIHVYVIINGIAFLNPILDCSLII